MALISQRPCGVPVSVTMETPSPPVNRVAVGDGGQGGVFVSEGRGEGPWLVSLGEVKDLPGPAVDPVPVVLRIHQK